jgi:GNAT superfamily N-acetyltransferase
MGTMSLRFEPRDPGDPQVAALYTEFIREADGPLGPDVVEAEVAAGPPRDLVPPGGVLLLGTAGGVPAALGGARDLDTDVAEIKSMYVTPPHRGGGAGRALISELERIAAERGCRAVRLDTSGYLTAAVALYRSAGYVEVADYNGNPKADLWFERQL